MIYINQWERLEKELVIAKTHEIVKRIKKKPRFHKELYPRTGDLEIEGVDLAEDGTVRMHIKDGKEPIRMYPDLKTVWFIAYYKRFIPLMIYSLNGMGLVKKIITLLAIKFNFNILPKWFEHIFSTYEAVLNDENYSQPVKEVRRVLKGRLDQNLIDALALILEYDSAYRNRFQDIIVELNKDNLNKPAKEIIRLLDILLKRDYGDNFEGANNSKWGNIKRLIKLVFIFSPKIKKQITAILKDINIDEVKFSKEDIYWINKDTAYLFRGMTFEERQAENKINYGE